MTTAYGMSAQIDPATREFLTFLVDSGVATILAIAVFILSVAALIQVIVSMRNSSNNGRLIEKLSVTNDATKDLARQAEIRTQQQGEMLDTQKKLLETFITNTELAKTAADNAKGARDDVDLLTKKHDSGVTSLAKLVKDEADETIKQVKGQLTDMQSLLTTAIETIDTRDERIIERITEPYAKLMEKVLIIQNLIEHVLPPDVRASIPVTLTGDLSMTPEPPPAAPAAVTVHAAPPEKADDDA